MRVGIFGGAFNPPHKMHKEIAIELLQKDYLDKIIYVPTGNNYNKPGLLDGKDRLNMLNLLIEGYNKECENNLEKNVILKKESKIKSEIKPETKSEIKHEMNSKIEVSDFEVKGSLYTINTLKHFKEIYPNDEIYFICGTDNFAEFKTWRSYEEILKNYKLLVIARKDNNFNDIIKEYSEFAENILLANIDMQFISSTMIRKEILENGFSEKLNNYLDESVIEYLKKLNLTEKWENQKIKNV